MIDSIRCNEALSDLSVERNVRKPLSTLAMLRDGHLPPEKGNVLSWDGRPGCAGGAPGTVPFRVRFFTEVGLRGLFFIFFPHSRLLSIYPMQGTCS
jgi:hypothetical protein